MRRFPWIFASALALWGLNWLASPTVPNLGAQLFGGGAITHVANNTALLSAPASAARVFRDGGNSPGDGGAALYTWFAATCTLNGGAGDGGSQVPALGGGCWIADFAGRTLSPMVFLAGGAGSTDDTVPVQAAINACGALGIPLKFDAIHLYKITTSVNIAAPCAIDGPYRYGVWPFNQASGTGTQSCPWGIVTRNTGIDMIVASAVTGSIHNLCIDATGDATVNPTSGYAIRLQPPSIVTYSSGWDIQNNSILDPYVGIGLPGNGGGAGCCGAGTSADGDVISHNTILSPTQAALEFGKNSAASTGGPGTVGITVEDNDVICKTATSKASAYGIVIYEGSIWHSGTANGPEGCNIGFAAIPGTANSVGQVVQISSDGVFGDQSGTNDLLIKPAAGGSIVTSSIGGIQPWANNTSASYTSVLIDCTLASYCSDITISQMFIHGGNGQNVPVMDIEGGANGPFNVTLNGIDICQQGTPGGSGVGLKLNAGNGSTGRWIIETSKIGTACNSGTALPVGIQLLIGTTSSSNGSITLVGNDLSAVTTPVSYTPNTTVLDRVVAGLNQGIDDRLPSIASATNIAYPGLYPVISVTGTTAVTTIGGGYSNQRLIINAVSGFTWNSGGGTGALCGASNLTLAAGVDYQFRYKGFGLGACWSHVQ
jgi:hypothetical protein